MNAHLNASLVACVVAWCGYQSAALGYTAGSSTAPSQSNQQAGAAGTTLIFARIVPGEAVVKVGDTLRLRVERCFPMTEAESPDPFFVCKTATRGTIGRWAVNGIPGGNVTLGYAAATTPNSEHAVYVAPPQAPRAQLAVSVEYVDPDGNERFLLNSRVTVVDPHVTCATLRETDVLEGGMTFSYDFSGAANDHSYDVSQSATITARLTRVRDNNLSTWTWRGVARVHPSLDASFSTAGVKQTVVGNAAFPGGSEMVVSVRLRDCTYQVSANAVATSIKTMEAGGIRTSTRGNTTVGSASSGMHPVERGMHGSGNFVPGGEGSDTLGRYSSGGFGNMLLADFKPGDLGKATVTWVVGVPERRQP